ncbi:dTDP-4-dehydrorhamnose reductase [Microbulbifer thermotolerans]|uniref:dTDP-4-dehydrorhamnose reductase n=1 Tax=Microbulbifer thermotolerans TaxID=252514 RepID=A0AB35HZE6_MICTH|nr:dTDP-4-dehydrorhamnose reductase [Microbulbifer thermotolerans]MCX2802177.1 dTDP-4-dehydrorhamnose reductase [Microbulbifer thermotolerans]
MKVLITGKNGQLAQELIKRKPAHIELLALARSELDITNGSQVMQAIADYQPAVVINAAAYTAVDKAEEEVEQAYAANATGPENLAIACKEMGARLIHISTDFVFNGDKSTPYKEQDQVQPLGVYGQSKAAGEAAIQRTLPQALILRTAWVYSAHGANFANTMLRLMKERDQLGVVADQIGTPTSTHTLAEAIYGLLEKPDAEGIYHCTDAGTASWYDFAVAIYEEGKASGLLPAEKQVQIKPIATADYPTPASRPAYSVLDKSRLTAALNRDLPHWRHALREIFREKNEA